MPGQKVRANGHPARLAETTSSVFGPEALVQRDDRDAAAPSLHAR